MTDKKQAGVTDKKTGQSDRGGERRAVTGRGKFVDPLTFSYENEG